jgi:hypothetical protein
MAPLAAEEVQKKSPVEAEPALTAVRDPQRPTNEYVLVRVRVRWSQSLCVIGLLTDILLAQYIVLTHHCTLSLFAECRLSILFIVYLPAIILCTHCQIRVHDGRLWYVPSRSEDLLFD